MLFRYSDVMYTKLDNMAVNSACMADAFEFLLQLFYVMNVEYPNKLCLVYGFLEKAMGMEPTVGRSVVLTELCQQVLSNGRNSMQTCAPPPPPPPFLPRRRRRL